MFTSAYSIYFIFFTLATAGLPVALSRLIAEADANGRAKQEEKTFRVALATFAVIGASSFALILFLFPEWLAAKYLENPDAALSIKAMAPSILLVCLVSAYRGYCQGNGNMIPTTVDEVLEVLFKVISGLILASCLLKAGFGKPVGSARCDTRRLHRLGHFPAVYDNIQAPPLLRALRPLHCRYPRPERHA